MDALLIIDIQNDFCPGGALEVPEGDTIIPVVNTLSDQFDIVLQTQDWHPAGHSSFASAHEDKEPYETLTMPYGEQVLWPDHCVQGSEGASFHPNLVTKRSQLIIRKGFRKDIDSYSAFYENDNKTTTGLAGYLRERNINTLYAVGLATDFCVKWSVLDGIKEGFEMYVVEDAVKGIDIEGSVDQAWKEMLDAGATRISSEDVLAGL
jgi:nicotinamidase/pyrazinamidase